MDNIGYNRENKGVIYLLFVGDIEEGNGVGALWT